MPKECARACTVVGNQIWVWWSQMHTTQGCSQALSEVKTKLLSGKFWNDSSTCIFAYSVRGNPNNVSCHDIQNHRDVDDGHSQRSSHRHGTNTRTTALLWNHPLYPLRPEPEFTASLICANPPPLKYSSVQQTTHSLAVRLPGLVEVPHRIKSNTCFSLIPALGGSPLGFQSSCADL